MSASSAETMHTPPSARPSKSLEDYPRVSPSLQKLLRTPKSSGSYGCQREVYHPLSPKAEPSACIYYESDDSTDDEEGPASPPTGGSSHGRAAGSARSSPLNFVRTPDTVPREPSRLRTETPSSPLNSKPLKLKRDIVKESPQTNHNLSRELNLTPSRKRSPESEDSHDETDPSSPTKRSRNSIDKAFEGRALDFLSSTPEAGVEDVRSDLNELSSSLPGGFRDPFMALHRPIEPSKKVLETLEMEQVGNAHIFSGASEGQLRSAPRESLAPMDQQTPPKHRGPSPRRVPLPPSPEDLSEIRSRSPSPLPYEDEGCQPLQNNSSSKGQSGPGKNFTAKHISSLAKKMQILNIKAHEYSEAVTFSPADQKYMRELDKIYNSPDRFDPAEAWRLEDEWQAKVKAVVEKEEARLRALERARQQKMAEERARIERLRRAEEEERRRQEAEFARRRQEEARRKLEAESARIKAEQERAEQAKIEQERQRQAEEVRKAREAKAAAEQAARQAQAAQTRAAQAQAAESSRPGRKAVQEEKVAFERVRKALHDMRVLAQKTVPGIEREFVARSRNYRLKLSQITGDKQLTVKAREWFIGEFAQLQNDEGPKISGKQFFLIPPAQDAEIPIRFIYAVNELAKAYLQQCEVEMDGATLRTTEPMGVALVSTFNNERLLFYGRSFAEVFIARALKKNPCLRYEIGNMDVVDDRFRLGWFRNTETQQWEEASSYANRMGSAANAYAALVGRDFRQSKMANPYPMYHLWNKLVHLLNIPAEQLTNGHYDTIRYLLLRAGPKLVSVYGIQAKKLIEYALGPFVEDAAKAGHSGGRELATRADQIRCWRN